MPAGGVSVNPANAGKESANIVDASCSRNAWSNCLMDNPSPGRMSPIEGVKVAGHPVGVGEAGRLSKSRSPTTGSGQCNRRRVPTGVNRTFSSAKWHA